MVAAGPLLADGAVGTNLMAAGVDACDVIDANLTNELMVSALHDAYVNSGAQLITSNTFGLRSAGTWGDAAQRGLALVEAAANRTSRNVAVLFSIMASHVQPEQGNIERILAAREDDAPLILLETCTDMRVVTAAVSTLKRVLPHAPLAITCHFKDDCTMLDGTHAGEVAKELTQLGVQAVGVNCCDSLLAAINVVDRMHSATNLPVFAQPNAGLPTSASDGSLQWALEPEGFAAAVVPLWRSGATVIGGCCGTRSEHISAAARSLQSLTTH
jgi:methionine synthase I (cobalamin-dependent)